MIGKAVSREQGLRPDISADIGFGPKPVNTQSEYRLDQIEKNNIKKSSAITLKLEPVAVFLYGDIGLFFCRSLCRCNRNGIGQGLDLAFGRDWAC